MSVEHKNISRSNIHEPKGVEDASLGDVYVADGQGSGEWSDVFEQLENVDVYAYNIVIDDLDFDGQRDYPIPVHLSANIISMYASISEQPGQAITVEANIGGSPVTSGSITFTPGSITPKTPVVATPTGNTLVSLGDYVDLHVSSTATAVGRVIVTLVFKGA